MPDQDRHWRGLAILGLFLGVGSAAGLIWYLWPLFSPPHMDDLASALADLDLNNLWLWPLLMLGGIGVWFEAMHARRREQIRAEALNGNLDAMPPARPEDTAPLYHLMSRARRRRINLIFLGIALVLALSAAGAVFLPLTHVIWANLYVAATLGIAALDFAVTTLSNMLASAMRRHRQSQPPYQLPIISTDAESAYGLVYSMPMRRRLVVWFCGITLLLNGAVYVVALTSNPTRGAPEAIGQLRQVVEYVVLLCSLAGAVDVMIGVWGTERTTVIADKNGLEKNGTVLRWEEVDHAAVVRASSRNAEYAVWSQTGRMNITWKSAWVRERALPTDIRRVTSDELAAIVCQRSGKPLHIEQP